MRLAEPGEPDDWARPQTLHTAWLDVLARHRKNEFDRIEFDAFSIDPTTRCAMLSQAVRAGDWRPRALYEVSLRKPGGGTRVLRVPALDDRVVQGALAAWLSDRLDGTFASTSHAYRPGRGVQTALRDVAAALATGCVWVLKADIRDFFDSIDSTLLTAALSGMGAWVGRAAHLIRQTTRAEVAAKSGAYCLFRGLPQGSPLSPVLSNVYLHGFDLAMARHDATLVRFADDFVLMASTQTGLHAAAAAARAALRTLRLELNDSKCQWHLPGDEFEFLGQKVLATRTGASIASAGTDIEISAGRGQERPTDSDAQATSPALTATPLLRTLYLLTPGTRLSRDGDSVLVEAPNAPARRVPGTRVNQILAFGATTITSGAISLCLEMGIPVMLASAKGHHYGLVDPLVHPQLALLAAQLRVAADDIARTDLACSLIEAKLRNSTLMLRRWSRPRPSGKLDETTLRVRDAARRAASVQPLAVLRGTEGAAAAAHFRGMGLILGERWAFERRQRQPPPDPINSMLSYGYTVLYYNMLTLVMARGLHPHVGMFHATRGGHHALVSDLIEPFRAIVVDAVVMDLALNGAVKPAGFSKPAAGAPCLMSDATRRRVIEALEAKLNTRVELRALGVKLDMRRLMDMQVLSLVDMLLGRTPKFQPYLAS